MHINDITNYKFNIRPEYFGDESNYTESFPKKIKEILKTNNDAKYSVCSTGIQYMGMNRW